MNIYIYSEWQKGEEREKDRVKGTHIIQRVNHLIPRYLIEEIIMIVCVYSTSVRLVIFNI
jgi:hypothetical protein